MSIIGRRITYEYGAEPRSGGPRKNRTGTVQDKIEVHSWSGGHHTSYLVAVKPDEYKEVGEFKVELVLPGDIISMEL